MIPRNLMHLKLRAIKKLLATSKSLRDWEADVQRQKVCTIGEGACLYPECRVENLQMDPTAVRIGPRCRVFGQLLVFRHAGSIQLGESCFVGQDSRIWSAQSVAIGNRVLISHGVNIHDTVSHSLSAALRHEHFNQIFSTGHPGTMDDLPSAPITIEDDAWLGFNSVVLRGVTIGAGAIVGAASVVTKDVMPFSVVAGNPARIVGESRP